MSDQPAPAPAVTRPDTYEIQGRTVELPMHIARAEAGGAVFSASAAEVTKDLPFGLEPVLLRPGRTAAVLLMVDYQDNPLGDYDEGVVATPVVRSGHGGGLTPMREVLSGRVGLFVHHMPVSQAFTREAGETIWGYPKTLDTLELRRRDGRAGLRWATDDGEVLQLNVPRGGRLSTPKAPGMTWTFHEGQLLRTPLQVQLRGARFGLGGASLRLGTHPIADQLRRWELSRRALMTAWVNHAELWFNAAQPAL